MKSGIIDVGGGLRGVYAAGVFDRCLDMGVAFDVCIGVSAGSANVVSYMAGQKGRNYPFYTGYPFRREYMSLGNLLFKKSYLDLDYIYGTLSNADGENPLDYQAILRNPAEFVAVATDARTGQAIYFGKDDLRQDDYSVLKASSAIPVVCHPYSVAGVPCFDGALSDAVPLRRALDAGCDRVVLVLTRPKDLLRKPGKDETLARLIRRRYPMAAQQLCRRAERYNRSVAEAKRLEEAGRVCILAPDDTWGVDTLTKDREALKGVCEKGCADAAKIGRFLG